MVEALCTPTICSNVLNQDVKTVSNHYEHHKNLQLADFSNESNKCIDVLIGVDYYYSCILGETKRGKDSDPIAVNSHFGWIIYGHYENSIVSTNLNSVHMLRANMEVLNDYDFKQENIFNDFKKLFNSENHGSSDVIDDVYFSFKNKLKFIRKRYETKLPFKEHSEILPDNYQLTQCRLKRLKRSLDKNKILLAEYNNIIREYIDEGIVEVVEPDDVTHKPGSTHYLPHRAVIRENHSTKKVRIVFDGSAHNENEPSINNVLYSGPCLLPLIFGILVRFRIGKIGIVADVKQVFLQIERSEEHRNFLRFLWFKDVFSTNSEQIILHFKRVIFVLTCSPFLLNGTVRVHLEKYLPLRDYTEIVRQLLLNLYVDDISNSFNSIEQSFNFYKISKTCLLDANFQLRKWASKIKHFKN